ncbi:hypothetical protein [Mitsuokella multacida]|uniref:hypothetical protein n=1 Tax=Mitsuokella multacida TaxID=52226 RepID=UPI003F631FB5
MAGNFISSDEAETAIVETAKVLLQDGSTLNDAQYGIYAAKLVGDVLDYCHRDDFPKALIYTCADLLVKRVNDAADDTKVLKSIKMDDTQFDFAHGDVTAGNQADADFETIRPKLNLYRKIGGWS